MGRKVNPIGFRLGVNKTWDGRWYAEGKDYTEQLHQDFAVRKMVRELNPRAGISRIEIERFPGNVRIFVHTSKPGVLIGRKGENVKVMRKELEALVGMKVVVYFRVMRNGDVMDVRIEEPSGNNLLDRSGLRAVLEAGTFRELPDEFDHRYMGVHFGFTIQ